MTKLEASKKVKYYVMLDSEIEQEIEHAIESYTGGQKSKTKFMSTIQILCKQSIIIVKLKSDTISDKIGLYNSKEGKF